MQSQSQRHEAQLHFGLVLPVYRKILSLHTKASLDRFFGCFGKCLKYPKWDTIRNAHWSPSTYNSYAFMTDEKELFAIQLRKVAFGYFSVFFKGREYFMPLLNYLAI